MSAAAGVATPKTKGRKGKLIVVAVAATLLVGGVGGWFSGLIPRVLSKEQASAEPHEGHGNSHGEAAAKPGTPVFVDMPEIVANLNSGTRRTMFIKLKAKLELARPEDEEKVQAAMPRVLDLFQGYLREMRPEELRGTASTYRLREELVARTNIAASPAKVVAVLFTEMIVQ